MRLLLFLPLLLFISAQETLVGSASAADCSPSWQENRDSHVPTDLTSDTESLLYLAQELADEQVRGINTKSITMIIFLSINLFKNFCCFVVF